MLSLLYSSIDRGEYEKYLFLPLYGNKENPLVTACAPKDQLVTVKRQKDDYAFFCFFLLFFPGMTSTPCHHPQHLMENAGLRCQTNVNEAPDPQML